MSENNVVGLIINKGKVVEEIDRPMNQEEESLKVNSKPTINQIKLDLLSTVEYETERRIEAIISKGKQLRLLAKGLLITKRIAAGTATAEEIAIADEIEDFDVSILQPIRDAGTVIEAEIESGLVITKEQIEKHAAWSA